MVYICDIIKNNMKNSFTVKEVKGSKRSTDHEYTHAIIGKPNVEYLLSCEIICLKDTTYQPRIEQLNRSIERLTKLSLIPNLERDYVVLRWSKNIQNATKGLSNGIFQRNYTDIKIVETIAL